MTPLAPLAAVAALALPLLASPASAQEDAQPEAPQNEMAVGDDCAFLVRAFDELYRGVEAEQARMDEADMDRIMMHLQIQANTVQLADAAGCDVRPMVAIARRQLQRYDDPARAGAAQDGD